MLHAIIDFLRTLTTPERLIQLLSTGMSGWWGYALLTAIASLTAISPSRHFVAGLAVQSSTRPLGGDLVDEKNVPGAGTRKP